MPARTSPRLTSLHIAGYVLLCLIWGTTWLAIRVVVEFIPPLRAATLRFAFAAAILAIPVALGRLPMPSRAEFRSLLVLSIGMMALPYGLLFWAEQRIPSSTTAVLFAALPLITALLTPLLTDQTVPRRAVYAMLFASGGVLVIFSSALSADVHTLLGGLAILLAVTASAWSLIYAKRNTAAVHPVVSTAFQLALGAFFLLIATIVFERHPVSHWTRTAFLALGFLTVFGSVIAFSVYYWLLLHVEPYQVATISLIVPIIAIAEGAFLGHERIPLTILIAAALILGSVASVLLARADDSAPLSIAARGEQG